MKLHFLSYLIFLINLSVLYTHRCGTDFMNIRPYKINNDRVNENRRLSTNYSPIKIKVDYTQLKYQINNNQIFSFYEEVFQDVSNYFNALLSVQHINVELDKSLINNNCEISKIGKGVEKWLYENDVVIFPYIDFSLEEEILAAATACLVLNDYRPVGGLVALNQNFRMDKVDSKEYLEMLLLHELSHVLAFHPYFFESLNLLKTEIIDGYNYTYINSSNVLEKAKIHFNCENIKGIQLEDQGGEGSVGAHWESRYMLGDYMISTDYTEVVISDITLALFEDTGFYKVNYYTGGLFRFGKNQGCAFLEEDCIHNLETSFPNEFCVESGRNFCGSSHLSRGICGIFRYTEEIEEKYQYFGSKNIGGIFSSANYCPVSFYLESSVDDSYYYPGHCNYGYPKYYGETIGEHSFCFESSLVPKGFSSIKEKSICYEIECDKFEKQIIIKIGSSKVICNETMSSLIGPDEFLGEITCPDYNLVCSAEIQCNDMIDCIKKKSTALRNTYIYIKSNKIKINYSFLYLIIIFYLL